MCEACFDLAKGLTPEEALRQLKDRMRNADDPAEYRAEIRWVNKEYRDRFNAPQNAEARSLVTESAAILEGPPTHALFEYA